MPPPTTMTRRVRLATGTGLLSRAHMGLRRQVMVSRSGSVTAS